MKKRIVSLLMALALCLSLLPTAALAAEGEPAEQLVEQEQLKPAEPAPAEPEEGAPVEDAEEEEKEELPEEPEQEQQEEQDAPALLLAAAPRAVEGETHSHPICGDKDCTTHGKETWTAVSALSEIKVAGKYYLTQDVTLTDTWKPANVFLCLNGHKITGADGKAVIELSIAAFTLTDCKGTGKITHASGGTGCGVYISGGTFNMYGGSITGNTATDGRGRGGGVYVTSGGGAFKMFGGSITGNKATDGGGVYKIGSNSTFTMTGGSITGNTADDSGGGVYVNGGSFTMSGGSITGNTADGNGGGVYVNGGTFEMSGSAGITGNKADSTGGGVCVNYDGTFNMSNNSCITGNTAYHGGGVYVGRTPDSNNYKPGNFAMSGGTIGGATTDDANQAQYGGGVYVAGTFTLTGGSITGNKTNGNGGGVYVNADSTFTVSGAPKITNNTQKTTTSSNVYLTEGPEGKPGAVIVIGDAHLASGAEIGVRTGKKPTDGTPVTIATNANSGDKQYFSSDVSKYSMYVEGSELKLAIVPAHEHRWTYTASNATTITATCGDDSCTSKDGGSITINKPSTNLTYSGSEKAARLTESNWQGGNVTITYKQGDKVLTGAPVNAGTYTASITLGGATASVEYTIAKATPTADDFTFTAPSNLTYDGNAKTASVNSSKSGMGAVTLKYYKGNSPLSAAPTDAGEYTVKINVAEGTNYNAASDLTADGWKFSIAKASSKKDETVVKEFVALSGVTQKFDIQLPTIPADAAYGDLIYDQKAKDADKNEKDYTIFASGASGLNKQTGVLNLWVQCGEVGVTQSVKIPVTSTNYGTYYIVVKFCAVAKAPANVTVTGLPAKVTYGDAGFILNASVTNKGEGTGVWTWSSSDGSVLKVTGNGASAKVEVVGTGNAAITAAYESETTSGTGTTAEIAVSPRTITVTADNKTMTVNGKLPEFTVSYGNLPDGVKAEDIFGTLPTASTTADGKTVGEFDIAITESSLKDDCKNNYTVEIANGKLTVTKQSGGYYYYTPAAGGTTDANKSPRTGDAGLLVYGLTALSSYTGTALVLRRKRED